MQLNVCSLTMIIKRAIQSNCASDVADTYRNTKVQLPLPTTRDRIGPLQPRFYFVCLPFNRTSVIVTRYKYIIMSARPSFLSNILFILPGLYYENHSSDFPFLPLCCATIYESEYLVNGRGAVMTEIFKTERAPTKVKGGRKKKTGLLRGLFSY